MGAATLFILVLALISLALSYQALSRDTPLEWRFVVEDLTKSRAKPKFEQVFDYAPTTGQAHSPAILVNEQDFQIVWFEGSAEAQADVDIWGVRAAKKGKGWDLSEPAPVITRDALGKAMEPQQLVVTLGNTVQNEAVPNHAYATVVSLGGWAAASVADVALGENGAVTQARKLNLSPLLNRSHLVKSPMVAYADGTHALPAYFEMGATYGTLVRLGEDGRVRDARRMTGEDVKPIQPMIVPLSAERAVAFLRDFDPSGKLLISRTEDGGQSWSAVESTDVPNPSAPVAALLLSDGRILIAMNDDAARSNSLSLALSDDEGASWSVIHTLEDEGGDARYPMLRRLPDGQIVLTYSHGSKKGVRAFVFNEPWVMAQ